jgi:hypothetical protein
LWKAALRILIRYASLNLTSNHTAVLFVCFLVRRLLMIMFLAQVWAPASHLSAQNATEESLRHDLSSHASPLHPSGEALLLKEAQEHQYFLLGELHGEIEIPQLLSDLWPGLWRAGYRHVAAEVSPWAATHLQRSAAEDPTPIRGLWTREQAAVIGRFAGQSVLWGCDIEEPHPDRLIQQLARLNSGDARLRRMVTITSGGYSRKDAPELLRLAESGRPAHDVAVGGESLWTSMLD